MSKVTFTKLGLKKLNEIKVVKIKDQDIEIRQYLPIEDKIKIVENVLINSADENNFANPIKLEVFLSLEVVYNYTNLTFTDKQKEDAPKLYDLLEENNIIEEIISNIPEVEYNNLIDWTQETIESFYKYKTSALGIVEALSNDYSNLNMEAEAIQKKLSDPENMALLKEVANKLG